jgi:hypothetical protein
MVIPPVTGTEGLKLYLIVVADNPDGPLTIPTWACDLIVAEAAAIQHGGVVYRAEQVADHRRTEAGAE